MANGIKDRGQIIPEAYHGTDLDSADMIVKGNAFSLSIGDDHYLGDGAYFFENSVWHAKEYGKKTAKRIGATCFGVIKATIKLGRSLDLNDYESRQYIRQFAKQLQSIGVPAITEGVVINMIAKKNSIDTVRATYTVPDKGKILPNSRFFEYSGLMICVRNGTCISDLSITYRGLVI